MIKVIHGQVCTGQTIAFILEQMKYSLIGQDCSFIHSHGHRFESLKCSSIFIHYRTLM